MNYSAPVLPVLLLAFFNNIFSYIQHFTNGDKKILPKMQVKTSYSIIGFHMHKKL
jgi:hypothetical protein